MAFLCVSQFPRQGDTGWLRFLVQVSPVALRGLLFHLCGVRLVESILVSLLEHGEA